MMDSDLSTHQHIIEQLEQRIVQVDTDLTQCQQLTDQMCRVLDGFEDRLSVLGSTMVPIHHQTQSLTIAQKNIDRTIEEVDLIQRHTIVAQIDESKIDEKNFERNLNQFCSQISDILAARSYFESHTSIANSPLYLHSCQNLVKKSIKVCESEFKRIIECDSKIIDFTQLPWPLPTDYQPISSSTLNTLGSIAACLQRCGSTEHIIQRLTHTRMDVLRSSLETASAVHRGTLASDLLTEESQRMAQKVKSRLLGIKKRSSSEQYERGSHRFIKFIKFLLFLMKIEQKFIVDLFALTQVPSSDVETCMSTITNSLFECVLKEADELQRKKSDSKVLILLDILDNIYSLMDKHLQLDLRVLRRVAVQLIDTIRKAIDYKKEKIAHSYSKQQFPVNGGYDPVTIQTVNFISRFFEYKATLELCGSTLPSIDVAISYFLTALDSSLEQKARSCKNICLMHIFIMNNANYILKNIRLSPELTAALVHQRILPDLEQRLKYALENYRQAAWSKLLSYIDRQELSMDPSIPLTPGQKKSIKQSFAGFNATFEELYSAQKQFSVPDPDLRSQLRNANVELVVPKYHAFLER